MQTILADDMSWSALDFSMDPPTYRFKVVLSSIIEYLSFFTTNVPPRTFRVEFSSPDTVAEFRDMFAEGKVRNEQI